MNFLTVGHERLDAHEDRSGRVGAFLVAHQEDRRVEDRRAVTLALEDDVTKVARAFLDPVLAGDLDAAWSPETWTWDRR